MDSSHSTMPSAPILIPLACKIVARLSTVLVAGALMDNGAIAADDFQTQLKPLLKEHCYKCHKGDKQKGGLDLEQFAETTDVLKKYKLWRRVLEQVQTEEMPPDDDTDFGAEHRAVVTKVVQTVLAGLEVDDPATRDPGPALIRRLSRVEYNAAIRDLTALDLNVAEAVGMPLEPTGTSYDNIAAALGVQPTLMEKYFAAAEIVLAQLFADPDPMLDAKPEWERKKVEEKVKPAREKFFAGVSEQPEREEVSAYVVRFARQAWRRLLRAEEVDRLMGFYDAAVAKGLDCRTAFRRALKPVLVSPFFLFRVEGLDSPPASIEAKVVRLHDLDLASRLSFFLWSSLPDEELLAAAEQGALSEPATLEAQVRRMLRDPKAGALTRNFFEQWLGSHKVDLARPSTEFFPAFNSRIRSAMREEVRAFCDHLRLEDRPVLDLIDADYTFANPELAKFYGLKAPQGKETQRVALRPEDHRGGVLGMGAILASTSHTSRTSPSLRGHWVLDVIFGTPPPPPPPEAGQFKDEGKKKEAESFREKLAQHAGDASCQGCHKKMDPLGFGLDNYDAVGQWRETSAELDTSGVLPTGEKLKGAKDLKAILWARRDQITRNLITQLFTYALGREPEYFDEAQISKIKASMDEEGSKFSSLVLGIIRSYPFQHRRVVEEEAAEAAPKVAAQ